MKEIKVVRKNTDRWLANNDGSYRQVEEVHFIKVDDSMYSTLIKYPWYMKTDAYGFGYAATRVNGIISTMHSFIIGCPIKPLVTDHIDGDRDNCQHDNLAIVTQRQNTHNTCLREGRLPGAYLKVKGVTHGVSPWKSAISFKRKITYIGSFDTQVEAFFAYKEVLESGGEYFTPWVLEKCYKIIDAEMVHI